MTPRALLLALALQPLIGCYWMIWDPAEDYPETGVYEAVCGAGEIRRISTGQGFDSLEEAFGAAQEQDAFCLGPGEYEIAQPRWMQPDPAHDAPSLALVGAGSERTSLVGPGDSDEGLPSRVHLLAYGEQASIALTGLAFRDATLFIDAPTVRVDDLRVGGAGVTGKLLDISSQQLAIQGLELTGEGVLYDVPMVIRGDGRVHGLRVSGVELYQGYLLETYGDLTLVEPEIRGTTLALYDIGFPAIEAFGPLSIEGGELSGNLTNGPLIYAWDKLVLQDLTLEDNTPRWRGLVTLEDHALVSGGSVARNQGGSGAFELVPGASVTFDEVDFGVALDRNIPCDVAANLTGGTHTLCLATELGPATTLSCDDEGCD